MSDIDYNARHFLSPKPHILLWRHLVHALTMMSAYIMPFITFTFTEIYIILKKIADIIYIDLNYNDRTHCIYCAKIYILIIFWKYALEYWLIYH